MSRVIAVVGFTTALDTVSPKKRSQLLRVARPDFSHDEPFIFRTGRWTPPDLKQELGIEKFGKLSQVHALCDGVNDTKLCEIVSWWSELGYKVSVKFPCLPSAPAGSDGMLFGLEIESAYRKVGGFWRASKQLRRAVSEFFSDNPNVRVCS